MNLRTSFLKIICAICFTILAASAESGDARLTEFIRKFDLMDKAQANRVEWFGNSLFVPHMDKAQPGRADWLGPESPFAPYLDHSVVESLGKNVRALYGKAFNAGACRLVRMLGTVGFLNRYPHLAPAFEQYKVQLAFEVYALPKLTQNKERCVSNRREYDNLPRRPEIPARQNHHG